MSNILEQQKTLLLEMDSDICLHSWHDHTAQELMDHLCQEIGPRSVGSRQISHGRNFLAKHLTKIGACAIHEEPVPVRSWEPGEPIISLKAPIAASFPCGQYLYSQPIDATLPLIDIGVGTLDDIARHSDRLLGKAVLMEGHIPAGNKYVSVRQRIKQVQQAGASAIILRSSSLTGLPALDIADMNGEDIIACLSISRDSGNEISTAAARGEAEVYLRANGKAEPVICANLVADLGPDTLPEEIIILGAHFDSYWNAPGASDNLSGVVTMLEVARLLAPFRHAFRRTLRVIAFTGEETGCLGSRAYVRDNREAIQRTSFMMSMDTMFTATARGTGVMWSPEMRDYLENTFNNANRSAEVRNIFSSASDYFPFMLAGIPSSRPADWDDSYPIWWHSEKDDLQHFHLDWIQHNAMVYAHLFGRLLTDPLPLPGKRLSFEEVLTRLEQEYLGDWMQAQGYDWPLQKLSNGYIRV